MFLSSQEEFNDFHKNDFNIDGVELISSRDEPGYQQYDVKILKNNFLGSLFKIYFHISLLSYSFMDLSDFVYDLSKFSD